MTAPKTQAGDRIGVLTLEGLRCRGLDFRAWGVDIRLRVWKERAQGLGHRYFEKHTFLHCIPNIDLDINIAISTDIEKAIDTDMNTNTVIAGRCTYRYRYRYRCKHE